MSKQSESPVSVHIEKVEGLQGAAEEFVRLVRGSTKFSGVMPMVVENGLCIALTGTGPLGTENAHRIAAALNGSQAGFDIGPVADGHTANHPYAVDPRVAFRQGACWAQALLAAPSAPGAQPEPPRSPLDDPKLQELFSATIDGAMASGFQGVAPAPEGHWLAPWWERGREYAAPSQREAGRELTGGGGEQWPENGVRYCLFCEKEGHRTSDCWSTHALNTPAQRELARLADRASAADRAARGEAGRALPKGQKEGGE
jgi:hypothetical protein